MKAFSLLIAVFVLIPACQGGESEKRSMLPEIRNVKAYCVGRSVVEMPAPFSLSKVTTGSFKTAGSRDQEQSFDIVVRESEMTQGQFQLELLRRREELSKKGVGSTDAVQLTKTLNNTATLFRVHRIDDAYVSEIDFLSGSNLVTIRLNSYDEQFIAAEERLIDFVAGITEIGMIAVGSQPQGFCLGPILIKGKFDEENGSFLFRDGRGDDFGIEISTQKAGGGTTLLARMSHPESLLSRFDVRHTVLRARERTVAGVPAQEWLGWTNLGEHRNEKTFGFALETMPQADGKTGTSLTLSFDTAQPLEDGARTKNFMSDDEAIQLWDSVVKSIRPVTG